MLVVGANNSPRCLIVGGPFEHFVFHRRKLIPAVLGLRVYFAQLSLSQRVVFPPFKPAQLLLPRDAKVELEEENALLPATHNRPGCESGTECKIGRGDLSDAKGMLSG